MNDKPHTTPDSADPTKLPVLDGGLRRNYANHPRRWEDFHYIYPVVSRRSGGLSIGINLNIDKACNFDCIYCCVDRTVDPVRKDVDLNQIREELNRMIELAVSGAIWEHERFRAVPPRLRRINDIAFSGDGEPTSCPRFDEACRAVLELKNRHGLSEVKIVVITNATLFDRDPVQRGFELLDQDHTGTHQIWAKLDAGTEAYYRMIERTRFPFQKVLDNILARGRVRPIVIQSLFMCVDGIPVPDEEFEQYLTRIEGLRDQGCRIDHVQLYTTARQTAEANVTPLDRNHMDRLLARGRERIPGLGFHVYYGVDEAPSQ